MSVSKTAMWMKTAVARARRPRRLRRAGETGSITALTLLALGMIVGAFMYVAVLGNRTAEITRARVTADATAMAAATIKARVLNYESFLLLGETVLLPLAEVTDNIDSAQTLMKWLCVGASVFFPEIAEYCFDYWMHVSQTHPDGPKETVSGWLSGLAATAEALDSIGPDWAEFVATKTGMSDGNRGRGTNGVTLATAYPLAGRGGTCRTLGVEMVGQNDDMPDGGESRNACHGFLNGGLEFLYILVSGRPSGIVLDAIGLTIKGHMVPFGNQCDHSVKAPKLSDYWKNYSVSHGMALIDSSKEKYYLRYLEALRGSKPPNTLGTGWLLGMGCAEHYSENHYSTDGSRESLWHMDWRARLVPCGYESASRQTPVTHCALPGLGSIAAGQFSRARGYAEIPVQFILQTKMSIAKNWLY